MTYWAVFFVLGLILAYRGIETGGWTLALLWPATSLCLVGLGYAGLGARVFGKQASGQMTLWARLIHLPLRLYLGAVWYLWCVTGKEDPYNQLAEDIFLGRLSRIDQLPEGVVNCVDLTAEFEATAAGKSVPNYICLPILDGSAPTATQLDAAIARLKPGKTFVHCAQGHGRTGVVAIALLAKSGATGTFAEGLNLLRKVRPKAHLNSSQRKFLRRYLVDKEKNAGSA